MTWTWGVDPGTRNIGVTLLDPTGQPVYVIDSRTVGSGARTRRVISRWGRDAELPSRMVRWAAVEISKDGDPLPHVVDAINTYPTQDGERAIVELVGGPVSRGLQIASGILQGVLWARTGHRPAEVACSTWRKATLGIKGGTNATAAAKLAKEWALVGIWPDGASEHAAESRFIARHGQCSVFCLP